MLAAAFALLLEPDGPVLQDFPDEEQSEEPAAPVQASAIETATRTTDVALETTQMRRYQEQWVEKTGRTTVGLTGIPATRFRGVVRFLEAFAAGKPADMRERAADVPLAVFIRRCVDDLKAIYYEGRMVMAPAAGGEEIARWFWGETAAGQLVCCVKERMETSEDPQIKAAAFGIAR